MFDTYEDQTIETVEWYIFTLFLVITQPLADSVQYHTISKEFRFITEVSWFFLSERMVPL